MATLAEMRAAAAERRPPVSFTAESIGVELQVRQLNGVELDEFVADLEPEDGSDLQAFVVMRKWLARLVLDDEGVQLFSDAQDQALLELSRTQILDLFDKAMRASGARAEEDDSGKPQATSEKTGGSASQPSGAAP